jgi:hypothetical protein
VNKKDGAAPRGAKKLYDFGAEGEAPPLPHPSTRLKEFFACLRRGVFFQKALLAFTCLPPAACGFVF